MIYQAVFCVIFNSLPKATDVMFLSCFVINQIATNHFCSSTLELWKIVPVLALKYFPEFLHL